MPYVDANGLRFHVQVLPERSPGTPPRPQVVMIHGLVVDNLSSYFHTIAHPSALVADTYLYDLRGHGRTDVPRSGYAVADHVQDLRGLLDAWGVEGPVHLVGNSFGGVIALTFAHLFPESVASLVLIEAHFAIEGWGEHMAGSLALAAFGLDGHGVQGWLERNAHRKLQRLARHSERLFHQTTLIDDLQQERPLPYRVLEDIDQPVLAIYGEESDILDRAYDLERHLPRCQLHIVPETNHSVLSEATPTVRKLTGAWLTGAGEPLGTGRGGSGGPAVGG